MVVALLNVGDARERLLVVASMKRDLWIFDVTCAAGVTDRSKVSNRHIGSLRFYYQSTIEALIVNSAGCGVRSVGHITLVARV